MGAIEGKQKMAHMQATGAMVLNLDLRVHSLIVKDPVPKQKAYIYIYVRVTVCVRHFYIKYHKIISSESFFKWCHSDIATRIPKQNSILQDKV